jgi:hypothetical protein
MVEKISWEGVLADAKCIIVEKTGWTSKSPSSG